MIIFLDFIISILINTLVNRLIIIYNSLVINTTPYLLGIYIDITVYLSALHLLEPRPRISIVVDIL